MRDFVASRAQSVGRESGGFPMEGIPFVGFNEMLRAVSS